LPDFSLSLSLCRRRADDDIDLGLFSGGGGGGMLVSSCSVTEPSGAMMTGVRAVDTECVRPVVDATAAAVVVVSARLPRELALGSSGALCTLAPAMLALVCVVDGDAGGGGTPPGAAAAPTTAGVVDVVDTAVVAAIPAANACTSAKVGVDDDERMAAPFANSACCCSWYCTWRSALARDSVVGAGYAHPKTVTQ